MKSVLERRSALTTKAVQENETLPECLRSYQPLVMLWSEKQPAQTNQGMSWEFSESYQGVTDVNYAMHDVIVSSRDANGVAVADCNFTF